VGRLLLALPRPAGGPVARDRRGRGSRPGRVRGGERHVRAALGAPRDRGDRRHLARVPALRRPVRGRPLDGRRAPPHRRRAGHGSGPLHRRPDDRLRRPRRRRAAGAAPARGERHRARPRPRRARDAPRPSRRARVPPADLPGRPAGRLRAPRGRAARHRALGGRPGAAGHRRRGGGPLAGVDAGREVAALGVGSDRHLRPVRLGGLDGHGAPGDERGDGRAPAGGLTGRPDDRVPGLLARGLRPRDDPVRSRDLVPGLRPDLGGRGRTVRGGGRGAEPPGAGAGDGRQLAGAERAARRRRRRGRPPPPTPPAPTPLSRPSDLITGSPPSAATARAPPSEPSPPART
jgi:hypothetical protein